MQTIGTIRVLLIMEQIRKKICFHSICRHYNLTNSTDWQIPPARKMVGGNKLDSIAKEWFIDLPHLYRLIKPLFT